MVGLVAGVVKVVKMVSICSGRGLGGLATEGGAGRHGVAQRRNGGDGGGEAARLAAAEEEAEVAAAAVARVVVVVAAAGALTEAVMERV